MSWANSVQTVGKWYQANIHDYNQGGYSQCSVPNCGKVRHDCSGFVSACLRAAGVFSSGQIFSSSGFLASGGAATTLRKSGFVPLPYSTSNVQAYDIIAYNGYVEIFAGVENGSWRSWSWGSCHDGKNGHTGEPCYTASKNRYVTIWRNANGGNIGMATAQTNWQSTYSGTSGGSYTGGGASDPTINNYATYTSDTNPAIFASAMNNSFTPSTTKLADSSTKHTRIYSATEVGIRVDEMSMALNQGTLSADGSTTGDITTTESTKKT